MTKMAEVSQELSFLYSQFMRGEADCCEVMQAIDNFIIQIEKEGCQSSMWIRTLVTQGFYHDMLSASKRESSNESRVYALYSERSGLTKIGTSKRLIKRISEIERGCGEKLTLVLDVSGDSKLEAELHSKYAIFRSEGEWFSIRKDRLTELFSISGNKALRPKLLFVDE